MTFLEVSINSRIGITNAPVFPVPFFALAINDLPIFNKKMEFYM